MQLVHQRCTNLCHKTKTIKGAGRLRSVVHLAVEPVAPQILARFVYDDAVQTYQGQKIRDGHERIHAVGNVPHNSEIGDAADENGNDVEHAVSVSPALTLEIFHSTPPLTSVPMPYEACIIVEMALACTVQPMPKAAMAVNTANNIPILRHPKPRSRVYIGPPSIRPLSDFTRYFIASNASEYFVEMPNTPVSQHQNTAPGPPNATAVATPMMFPVPMVAARAPNCDTSPFCDLSRCTEIRMAVNSLRCGKRKRTVRKTCVPSSSTIMGQPQRIELSVAKKSLTLSISNVYSLLSRRLSICFGLP